MTRRVSIIPANTNSSLEKEVFPKMLEVGGLTFGYTNTSYFVDIGIPEDYCLFKGKAVPHPLD